VRRWQSHRQRAGRPADHATTPAPLPVTAPTIRAIQAAPRRHATAARDRHRGRSWGRKRSHAARQRARPVATPHRSNAATAEFVACWQPSPRSTHRSRPAGQALPAPCARMGWRPAGPAVSRTTKVGERLPHRLRARSGTKPSPHRGTRGCLPGGQRACSAGGARMGQGAQARPKTNVPLVPPKPKLFFTARSIFISRAVFAQ
jgi:hypothetical protein